MGRTNHSLVQRIATRQSWENDLARTLLLGGLYLLFRQVETAFHPVVLAILGNALVLTAFLPVSNIFKRYPIGTSAIWAGFLLLMVWIASGNDPIAMMRLYTFAALGYVFLSATERVLPVHEEIEGTKGEHLEQARQKSFIQLFFAALNELVIFLGTPSLWVVFMGLWLLVLRRCAAWALARN
ncbi:MAG: hypothetical protein AAF718_10245 [Pseudomonadota bacterium]